MPIDPTIAARIAQSRPRQSPLDLFKNMVSLKAMIDQQKMIRDREPLEIQRLQEQIATEQAQQGKYLTDIGSTQKKAEREELDWRDKRFTERMATSTDQQSWLTNIAEAERVGDIKPEDANLFRQTPFSPAVAEQFTKLSIGLEKYLQQQETARHNQEMEKPKPTAEVQNWVYGKEDPEFRRFFTNKGLTPGVDVPFSPEVMAQKKTIAAAGRAGEPPLNQRHIDAYVMSLARGEITPDGVPLEREARGEALAQAHEKNIAILSDRERQAITDKESIGTHLATIEQLSKKINTAGPWSATAKGLVRAGLGKVNFDNDVAVYNGLIDAIGPAIARALGHIGILTDLDVLKSIGIFPRVTDSAALAQKRMALARDLFKAIEQKSKENAQKVLDRAMGLSSQEGNDPKGIR